MTHCDNGVVLGEGEEHKKEALITRFEADCSSFFLRWTTHLHTHHWPLAIGHEGTPHGKRQKKKTKHLILALELAVAWRWF